MKKFKYLFLLSLAFMLVLSPGCSSPATAPTAEKQVFVMSFQEGLQPFTAYSECLDSSIVESDPATTYYTAGSLVSGQVSNGKLRSLVKFSLKLIEPNTVKVKAAYLNLKNYYGSGTFKACRVTRSWSVDVSWNLTNGFAAWTTPGGDYTDDLNSGWFTIPSTGAELIFKLDNSMVESWIMDDLTNYGVIIIGQNEGTADYQEADFESSEGNLRNRPVLTVYYTLD